MIGHERDESRGPMPAAQRISIRRARVADAPMLAKLHCDAMPLAFLPQLGPRFLTELYRAATQDETAVTFVADDGGDTVAFASGALSVPAFYRRFFRRHGLRAAIALVPRAIRPAVLKRVVETARYPATTSDLPDAELLSLAVASDYRRMGFATALVRAVFAGLEELGAPAIKVVAGSQLEEANAFYASLGLELNGQVNVHPGAPSNVWLTT